MPVLITPAGRSLRRPSLREVAQEAGLLRPLASGNENEILSDLTIVGAGPAGLAAAVYAASEGLSTVVLESYAPGGQAGSSSLIENFFGFPTGVSGDDLTWRLSFRHIDSVRDFRHPRRLSHCNTMATTNTAPVLKLKGPRQLFEQKLF